MLKKMGLGGHVVTMFHGYDVRAALAGRGDSLLPLVIGGDAALAICAYNRNALLTLGFPPERMVDLPVGIDPDRFLFRERGQVAGDLHIVMVARLVPEKGIALAIEALALLRDTAVRMTVVGDGPCREEMQALARRLEVAERIDWRGAGTPADVAAALAAGDIFLLSSEAEALPVCIMEAMASGLPVVATNVGGVREMIEDGRTGILVPPRDAGAIMTAVRRLQADPDLCRMLSGAGRALVEERFDQKALVRRLAGLYQRLKEGGA